MQARLRLRIAKDVFGLAVLVWDHIHRLNLHGLQGIAGRILRDSIFGVGVIPSVEGSQQRDPHDHGARYNFQDCVHGSPLRLRLPHYIRNADG